MSGRSALHTPGATSFSCRPCRGSECGRCLGGRCSCDHPDGQEVIAPNLVPFRASVAEVHQEVQRVRSTPAPKVKVAKAPKAKRNPPGRPKQTPEAERRAAVEQAIVASVNQAAEAAGVTCYTIRKWAAEFGVQLPNRAGRVSAYSQEAQREAVDLALRLGSSRASERLGISRPMLVRWAALQGRPIPKGRPARQLGVPEDPVPPPPRDPKRVAPCCVAATLEDGRPPIGYCGPNCQRRP